MQLTDPDLLAKNCDRILERISPSQIEAFELCPRRWYNEHPRGLKQPETEAMRRGSAIGAEAEHYYKAGMLRPDAKYLDMVEAVLPLLGPPRPTVTVEEWVSSPTFEGGPVVRGRYDHLDVGLDVRVLGTEPLPMLSDIKSRSDFRYCKTEDELRQDLQLNAYARPIMLGLGLEKLALRHAYTRTKKDSPKGKVVTVVVTLDELQPRWERTVASAREMAKWATLRPATADPLPPNTEACKKYPPHGCPHRALCGFDGTSSTDQTVQLRRQAMDTPNGTQPSLMERLKAQQSKLQQGAAPAAPPQPAPAAAPAPISTVKMAPPVNDAAPPQNPVATAKARLASGADLRWDAGAGQMYDKSGAEAGGWMTRPPSIAERIALEEMVKAEPPGATIPPAPQMGAHGSGPAQAAPQSTAPSIVPPDAPPRTDQPGDEPAEKPKRARKAKEAAPVVAVAPAISVTMACDACGEKYQVAAGHACAGAQHSAGTPVPARAGTPAPAAAPQPTLTERLKQEAQVQPQETGLVLFVDMICTKGAHKGAGTMMEDWLGPIAAELAEEKGVADYRQISYTAKGDLAAKIRQYASTLPPVVIVSKSSPSADVFLEQVIPLASAIYQGTGR